MYLAAPPRPWPAPAYGKTCGGYCSGMGRGIIGGGSGGGTWLILPSGESVDPAHILPQISPHGESTLVTRRPRAFGCPAIRFPCLAALISEPELRRRAIAW